MESVSGSTKVSRPAGLPGLIDALHGEIVLRYAAGARVVDIGHGSPEIARWTAEVAESATLLDRDTWEADAQGAIRLPLPDRAFDLAVCLRTLPHVGTDPDSSQVAARTLLAEAARVTAPGGHVLVEIDNPQSLRGFAQGIRNPRTIVRTNVLRGEGNEIDRYDTLARLLDLIPPTLDFVRVHAARTVIALPRTLELPLVGRLLGWVEWWARDAPILRRFGAHLLVVLRRTAEAA